MLSVLSQQATSLYNQLATNSISFGSDFEKVICKSEGSILCKSLRDFTGFLPDPNLDRYFDDLLRKISVFITDSFNNILVSLPSIAINFFVMMFVLYYTLKDNSILVTRIKDLLPLKQDYKVEFINKFQKITFAVLSGNLLVAVIQGGIAAIGYVLFGVESPLFWAALTIIFALVPYVGTAFIWLPLSLSFLFKGYLSGDTFMLVNGTGLLLYGMLIVGTIDNFIRPKIIGATGEVHPIIVLLGVFGGLQLFGFVGILVGPVLLSLFVLFVEMYGKEQGDLGSFLGTH